MSSDPLRVRARAHVARTTNTKNMRRLEPIKTDSVSVEETFVASLVRVASHIVISFWRHVVGVCFMACTHS
eukprot:3305593-Amphidinium_carterae.1